MHSLLPILLLHCMLGQQAGAQDSPQATESRPRVIVHVNRSREVPAHVDYEDDEIIQIESLDGLHESWVKNELLSIIRLHDLTEPHKGVVITRNNQQHRGTIVREATLAKPSEGSSPFLASLRGCGADPLSSYGRDSSR